MVDEEFRGLNEEFGWAPKGNPLLSSDSSAVGLLQ
jgi:hypothetical protein